MGLLNNLYVLIAEDMISLESIEISLSKNNHSLKNVQCSLKIFDREQNLICVTGNFSK
jgi:hypothetical protein